MRVSEILTSIASWLENPNNEVFLLSEYNDDCLSAVAAGLSEAATALRKTAEMTDELEPEKEPRITSESIEEIAALASEFDSSGDPFLKKQASVLDELLLTIAAPAGAFESLKMAQESRIDTLKKKYNQPKIEIDEINKAADIKKAIDASGMTKKYRVLEHGLNSRYCPDHAGSMLARKGESNWQCLLDGKVFNFELGYKKENGDEVPGGSVDLQTSSDHNDSYPLFDNREARQAQ